jgi:hypothetical protein
MQQQQLLSEILGKRRDRAIAIILGVKERECDDYLPSESRNKLRKVVLDQVNDFHDFCADIVRSLDSGEVVLNEVYVTKLDAIHEVLERLEVEVASVANGT